MAIRHFDGLEEAVLSGLFHRRPRVVSLREPAEMIGSAIGATLYVPADRPSLVEDVIRQRALGAQAVVLDLEDAVRASARNRAIQACIGTLRSLASTSDTLPLVLVRVPDGPTLLEIARAVGTRSRLGGFVLPKFDPSSTGPEFLTALDAAALVLGGPVRFLPILEGTTIAHRETRIPTLLAVRKLIDRHRSQVICVRVGATDLAGAFGLRRNGETTIYDVRVVADAVGDIVNVFGREADGYYPISGPVWEHFPQSTRLHRPRLRQTPFAEQNASGVRQGFLSGGLDALIAEVELDRANGLVGKTVIHPSHVSVVNALHVVPYEEYSDAKVILTAGDSGGVLVSDFGNKMNELRPHAAWARRTMLRAQAFGVLRESMSFVDLMLAARLPVPA